MTEQSPAPQGAPKYLPILLGVVIIAVVGVLWTTPPKKKLPKTEESSHSGYSRYYHHKKAEPKKDSAATSGQPVPGSSAAPLAATEASATSGVATGKPAAAAKGASAAHPAMTAKEYTQNYVRKIYEQVYSKWLPPKSETAYHGLVKFRVAQDGSVSNVRVTQSTQNNQVDAAMRRTVELAAPYPPIPASFHMKAMDIEVGFNYDYPAQ